MSSWKESNWNMVFSGVEGAPEPSWPKPPYTVVNESPVIAEKPFIYIDDDGNFKYSLWAVEL